MPTPSDIQRSTSGLRVLVGDGDTVHRRRLVLMLELAGCHVYVASDALSAVGIARKGHIELAFLGARLVGRTGEQLPMQVRRATEEAGHAAYVPIVAVTPFALPSDRAFHLQHGMDDCLVMPIRRLQLEQLLVRLCVPFRLSA